MFSNHAKFAAISSHWTNRPPSVMFSHAQVWHLFSKVWSFCLTTHTIPMYTNHQNIPVVSQLLAQRHTILFYTFFSKTSMYIYIYTYSWSYPHYFVSLVVSQHILFLSSYQLFLIIISHSTHPSSWNCGIPNHQVLIGWSALDPVFKMVDGYHWRLIRVFMIMLGLQSLLYPKFVPLKLFICTPKLFPPQIHHLSFHGYIWSIACLLYLYIYIYIWSTTCLIYTYICTLYIYVHEYVYAYSSCHLISCDTWCMIHHHVRKT